MRQILTLSFIFTCFVTGYGQDSLMYKPYQKGVDPEYLTGLKKRFEISLGMGYTSINNLSGNEKTAAFPDHFDNLSSGVKVELAVGYNITEHLKASVRYHFRTTNEHNVYVLTNEVDLSEFTFYVSDNYRFSEIGLQLDYRIPFFIERLLFVPHVGAGRMVFTNTGRWDDYFKVDSKGWVANAGLGFDYLASNIIGIGLTSNYGYTRLEEHDLYFDGEEPAIPFELDDKFSFFDVLLSFYLFF